MEWQPIEDAVKEPLRAVAEDAGYGEAEWDHLVATVTGAAINATLAALREMAPADLQEALYPV